MRHFAAVATLSLVCTMNASAQWAAPVSQESASTTSRSRVPRSEEVLNDPNEYDVHLRGQYPNVWFEPTGVTASTYGWTSCYIGVGVDDAWIGNGNYMFFQINDVSGPTKQFLFNRNVVLKNSRLGVGPTSMPEYDVDVTKSAGGAVSGMFRNTSSAAGSYAALEIRSGDGVTSPQNAYTRYSTSETAEKSWRTGMIGGPQYRIRDTAGVDRMTISSDGASSTIEFNGIVSGTKILANFQDVAEWVPATQQMTPGTVVTLNPGRDNEVMPSNRAYDTAVAGVVSTDPGVLLGHPGHSKALIATVGRVLVNVDATHSPIQIGDLLVSGSTRGAAMRSDPVDLGNGIKIHRPGTIIGKALQPLPNGTGQILVLLSLQ